MASAEFGDHSEFIGTILRAIVAIWSFDHREGESPLGEFQSREWHISLANAFFSISIWREGNLDYL